MEILNKIQTPTRRKKPCQKDKEHQKNIERTIIAEFKTNFYQGVFYGFSK
ncbi:hypothetical protein V5H66_05980 [Helicobacter pylori]